MEAIGRFVALKSQFVYDFSIQKIAFDMGLWTALAKPIITILLGYLLTKKKVFPIETAKILSRIVMNLTLPCLAFVGLMGDFTLSEGADAIFNLVFGLAMCILFIYLGKLLFFWVKERAKKEVLSTLFAFGSAAFFSQPLINAIYGTQAYKNSNMANVAYLVLLYSYAYIAISGTKFTRGWASIKETMKKTALNPVIIAIFLGLFLWFLQIIPGSMTIRKDWLSPNPNVSYLDASKVPFWRIDVTLPWAFQVIKMVGSLSSPLVWFAIGCTLAHQPIKEAATDKHAWAYSLMKTFVAPLLVICALFVVQSAGKAFNFHELVSVSTLQANTILWMAPSAAVVVAYCIDFDKEKELASNVSVISTLLAIPSFIFWVFVLSFFSSLNFFFVSK